MNDERATRPSPPLASHLPDTSRVHITVRRLTLWPPCCTTPIFLQREVTDLQLTHTMTCASCRRQWKVSFLPDRRHGLQVTWRPPVAPATTATIRCTQCGQTKPVEAFYEVKGPWSVGNWRAQPCAACCQAGLAVTDR
jgi:hypothetical protein